MAGGGLGAETVPNCCRAEDVAQQPLALQFSALEEGTEPEAQGSSSPLHAHTGFVLLGLMLKARQGGSSALWAAPCDLLKMTDPPWWHCSLCLSPVFLIHLETAPEKKREKKK